MVTQVLLGGTGRPLIGNARLPGAAGPIDWQAVPVRLKLKTANEPGSRPQPADFSSNDAFIAAAVGGMRPAVLAAILNTVALNYFAFLNRSSIPGLTDGLWSVLLVAVSLMVGYAREKWSIAEMQAGLLSTDLARVRDEQIHHCLTGSDRAGHSSG